MKECWSLGRSVWWHKYIFSFAENQSYKRHQDIGTSFLRTFKKPTRTYSGKKSYMSSYYSPSSSAFQSYNPYSYPYPAPSPYSYSSNGNSDTGNEVTPAGNPVSQPSQYHCNSYPVTPGMNRTETFEINVKRELRFRLQGRAMLFKAGLSYPGISKNFDLRFLTCAFLVWLSLLSLKSLRLHEHK